MAPPVPMPQMSRGLCVRAGRQRCPSLRTDPLCAPQGLPAPLRCPFCFQSPWRAKAVVSPRGPQPGAAHWMVRSRASRSFRMAPWSRGAPTWAAPAWPFGMRWTASSPTSSPARQPGPARPWGRAGSHVGALFRVWVHLCSNLSKAGGAVTSGGWILKKETNFPGGRNLFLCN